MRRHSICLAVVLGSVLGACSAPSGPDPGDVATATDALDRTTPAADVPPALDTARLPDAVTAMDVPAAPDARDVATMADARDVTDAAPACDCSAACVVPACVAACGRDAGVCHVVHAFDLAAHMPAHLAVMFSMSWFGIPATGDPNGPGGDPGWGNWRWGGGCVATNNPTTCASFNGTPARQIASRHRPLAGCTRPRGAPRRASGAST